jgi:uncharacterized membrane protein
MKKFTLAAAAVLALASAAPAVADTKTSDDPFVSTQFGGLVLGPLPIVGTLTVVAFTVAASGDS